MPQVPFFNAVEKSGTLLAMALMVPKPVITIRFFNFEPYLHDENIYLNFEKLNLTQAKSQTNISIRYSRVGTFIILLT